MFIRRSIKRSGAAGFYALAVFIVCCLPQTGLTLPVVSIWNGLASPDGSLLKASNLAQLLVFTNANLTADNEIAYLETVNLGTSLAGAAVFSITHNAPKTSIAGDITVGVGNFIVNSSLIDLSGSITRASDGQSPAANRLFGSALTVNVLSNAADLQQAVYLTQTSAGQSTVNAAFGSASGLAFDVDTAMLLSGGLLSGGVAMNHAGSSLELSGYGFELDTGGGFFGIGSGDIAALSGQLKGFLDSGDSFNISFTQGLSGQVSVLQAVPIPAAAWLFGSALGLLGWLRRKPV